jgi:thiamine-monophosphate kinase
MDIPYLNESSIIEIFRKNFTQRSNIFLGIKTDKGKFNDAGAIELDDNNLLVVTTDMIGSKTHFPDIGTPEQFGKKSITVNISDLAALGAKPMGLVISTGFPSDTERDIIEKIAFGMNQAAETYSTCIFGGDVNRADDIIIAGTAIGITTKEKILTRNTAQIGDILCVTGTLGDAAAGYYAWKNKLDLPKKIKNTLYPRFLEPTARIKEALILRDLDIISSCGDISDGLGWEIFKTGQASNVGFKIYEKLLPINEEVFFVAKLLKMDPLDMILYYGEDFELVLTIKREKWKNFTQEMNKLDLNVKKIGEVCDIKGGNRMIREDNTEITIKNIGYDQFQDQNESNFVL